MPRISQSLLRRAFSISPLLPLTLRPTRDLQSAKNELRWLTEHAQEKVKPKSTRDFVHQRKVLLKLCRRRERGEPLQYILGSQPFGHLNIRCQHGVLIPRLDTETYTKKLVEVALRPRRPRDKALGIKNRPFLKDAPSTSARVVKVLDICSGSGCISILLHSLLREEINIKTTGWDISKKAVQLSNVNRIALLPEDANINFVTRDIFTELPAEEPCQYDIVISNPPYISTPSFDRQLSGRWKETLPTARSVRNWEPKEALVPPMQLNNFFPEDVFYRRILELNRDKFKSRILVLEVGDFRQAKRVAHLAHDVMGEGHWIEFWCDNIEGPSKWWRIHLPKQYSRGPGTTTRKITSLGSGSPRAVVIYKDWPRGRPCGEIRPNADRIGCDAKA